MRPRIVFALAGALAAASSLTLTACDASPYAASVNGQTITQNSLNSQLRQWAGNKAWVTSYNNANSAQAGGSGTTVQGDGGPGTYSSSFVANILTNTIQNAIVRRHLASMRQLPTPSESTTSRAVNEYLRSGYWNQFPQSLRTSLVGQLADQAPLTPASSDKATLQGAYQQIRPLLFSQLCVTQAAVETQADAEALVHSGKVGGGKVCYSQATMEDKPAAFRNAVLPLNPGQTSQPIKMSFGYEVVKVQSKATPGFDNNGVQRVLSVATSQNEPAAVTNLYRSAHVKVNPTYGSWSSANGQVNTTQLTNS